MRWVSVSSSCSIARRLIEDRHAFGENRAARQSQAVLRKISGGSSLGDGERAVIERVHSRQNFQQRRLARAVPANHANVVAAA